MNGETAANEDHDARKQTAASKCPTAALLIAHGSRRQNANDDLVCLAQRVRDRGLYEFVEISYLELAEPTIPQGIRQCVELGAQRVLMLPFFLSAGEHVAGDLERFRREAAAEYPQVTFKLCAPLGTHPLVVEVVLARLAEASG
jgi:sirohydrochlorin ferrochelatase